MALSTKLYSQGFQRLMFGGIVRRFLAYYENRLHAEVRARPELAELAGVVSGRLRRPLLESLANRLLAVCTRTLLLELNVARIRDRLHGETPQGRYDDYDQRMLTDPDYLRALFAEYPVLGQCMVRSGQGWVRYVAELLRHLAADERPLRDARLLNTRAAELTSLGLDLGDPHAGGRAVARLSFADGTQLVYKPRSVAAERAYLDTVSALRRFGLSVPLSGLRVLECDGHGWCEFVSRTPCASADELPIFYREAGAVLAVMTYLGAVDMHMENVVARGADFVPIDLETILHHAAPRNPLTDAYGRAFDLLNQSVLAAAILPVRAFGGRARRSVDVSAIGGGQPQLAPRPIPMIVDPFTDTARIEPATVSMLGADNRPRIDNVEVRPERYTEDIVSGFVEAYDIIAAHRDFFMDLLDSFGEVEVRYLARPTRRYGLFLIESFHPDYLRDHCDRERLLDKLWLAAEARPELAPLVEAEKKQLLDGDIPCFRTTPAGRDIRSPDGEVCPDFFAQPSSVAMAQRLAAFGPVHRAAQVRIIRDSMGTLPSSRPPRQWTPPAVDAPEVDRALALRTADELARYLADQAILGEEDVSWIGVSIETIQEETFSYKPMGTTLYDGLAGMALTFAYAGKVFHSDRYLDVARRATAPVVEHLRYLARRDSVESAGAFSGVAGMLYAIDHVGYAIGDHRYAEAIGEALPVLRRCAREEACPDLIGGLAGCAVVSLGLYRRYRESGFLEVAGLCGERLAEAAVDVAGAAAWRSALGGAVIGGFSHGPAGIAWPLFDLADELADEGLRELAWRAVRFDRNLFVPADGGWRDLREETADEEATEWETTGTARPYPAQWCHGAGGIGLSRLLILRHVRDDTLVAEVEAALRLTASHGFGANHSVCHGDFGALALFDLAARAPLPSASTSAPAESPVGSDRFAQHARLAGAVLRDLRRSGPKSGLAGGVEMPGLMLGIAGACLGLMRVAEPDQVPCVASLEMPHYADTACRSFLVETA